jgi:hypothetical protein
MTEIMTEIIAFAGAVSHVTNIAKAIFDTRDELKLRELKLEFSAALLDLHHKQLKIAQDYQAVLESNEAIKKQLATYEQWQQESDRYKLHQLEPGIFVYALKPEFATTQPAHWLCTTCYQDRQKSILHRQSKGSDILICPRDPAHQLNTDEVVGFAGVSFGSRRQRSLDG